MNKIFLYVMNYILCGRIVIDLNPQHFQIKPAICFTSQFSLQFPVCQGQATLLLATGLWGAILPAGFLAWAQPISLVHKVMLFNFLLIKLQIFSLTLCLVNRVPLF